MPPLPQGALFPNPDWFFNVTICLAFLTPLGRMGPRISLFPSWSVCHCPPGPATRPGSQGPWQVQPAAFVFALLIWLQLVFMLSHQFHLPILIMGRPLSLPGFPGAMWQPTHAVGARARTHEGVGLRAAPLPAACQELGDTLQASLFSSVAVAERVTWSICCVSKRVVLPEGHSQSNGAQK